MATGETQVGVGGLKEGRTCCEAHITISDFVECHYTPRHSILRDLNQSASVRLGTRYPPDSI